MHEPPTTIEEEQRALLNSIEHPQKRAFLASIAMTPNVVKAAAIADVGRTTHYFWMNNDEEYAAAFAVAWSQGIDSLEAEVVRRAMDGVAKPVFRNGKRALDFVLDNNGDPVMGADGKPKAVPAVIREYSDTLAIFVLNGHRSTRYRQRVDNRYVDEAGNDVLTLADIRAALASGDE